MSHTPKQKYLYAPDNWDTGWRTALRTAGSSPVNIACLGDSFSQGDSGVTDWMSQPWFTLMRSDLLTRYTHGGDFWPFSYSQDYQAFFGGSFGGTPPFSSIDTVNRNLGSLGYSVAYYWTPNPPAANLWTFTTPYACTDIDIITVDWVTGNWTYTVDGGGTNTVTIASVTSPMSLIRTQITGLANTTHTVICTGQSAALAHTPFGVATYKSRTTGLKFAWAQVVGATVGTYILGALPTGGQSLIWQGRSGASSTGFDFPSQPVLAIIALGINDCVQGYGLEGYQAGLRKICQALRRGNPACSILFMANSNPDGDNSELTTTFVNSISWPLFIDRMLNIAIDYNSALVNFHSKWGEQGVTLGFQTVSNPHPSVNGHSDISTLVTSIL